MSNSTTTPKVITFAAYLVLTTSKISERMKQTQHPSVVVTKKFMQNRKDALSLAQGIVNWSPPSNALERALLTAQNEPALSLYGPDEGMPALRDLLRQKITSENGLNEVFPCILVSLLIFYPVRCDSNVWSQSSILYCNVNDLRPGRRNRSLQALLLQSRNVCANERIAASFDRRRERSKDLPTRHGLAGDPFQRRRSSQNRGAHKPMQSNRYSWNTSDFY